MNLSAIILAGGESRRMGCDKAWVEFNGKSLIRLAVDKVREVGVDEIFISGRPGGDYSALGCPVLVDLEPGFGPLGGIERGLHECTSPQLLVLAVDLPHMTAAFMRKMRDRCDLLTGVVPKLNGEYEPLSAIYPRRCHVIASSFIAKSRRAARDFADTCFAELAVRPFRVLAQDAACFGNCNTADDLNRIQTKV